MIKIEPSKTNTTNRNSSILLTYTYIPLILIIYHLHEDGVESVID